MNKGKNLRVQSQNQAGSFSKQPGSHDVEHTIEDKRNGGVIQHWIEREM